MGTEVIIAPVVIAAMAGILKLVLSALKDQREGFETFLGNHMSKNTQALEDLVNQTRAHTHEIERLRIEHQREREYQERGN